MGYTVDAFEGVYDSLHVTSFPSQDGGRGDGDETLDFEMSASIIFYNNFNFCFARRWLGEETCGIVYIPRVPKANQDVS